MAPSVTISVNTAMVQALLVNSPTYSRICCGKYDSLRLFFTAAPGIRRHFSTRIGIHLRAPRIVVRWRPAQCKQHYVSVDGLPGNGLIKPPICAFNAEAL